MGLEIMIFKFMPLSLSLFECVCVIQAMLCGVDELEEDAWKWAKVLKNATETSFYNSFDLQDPENV